MRCTWPLLCGGCFGDDKLDIRSDCQSIAIYKSTFLYSLLGRLLESWSPIQVLTPLRDELANVKQKLTLILTGSQKKTRTLSKPEPA